MKNPSNTQILVGVHKRWSDRNDEYYYELDLIDGDTGEARRTYVSNNNYNAKPWMQAIQMFELDNSKAIVLCGDYRIAKNKPKIISADVRIEFDGTLDRYEVLSAIL